MLKVCANDHYLIIVDTFTSGGLHLFVMGGTVVNLPSPSIHSDPIQRPSLEDALSQVLFYQPSLRDVPHTDTLLLKPFFSGPPL